MRKRLKKEKGFALVTVVLVLSVISILGASLMSLTSSTLKMVKMDSRGQAAYYIAEAGLNHGADLIYSKTEAEFQDYMNEKNWQIVLSDFEENNGETPQATINIEEVNEEGISYYKIESIGKIGSSKRIASFKIYKIK